MRKPARIIALTALLICITVSLIIASAAKKGNPHESDAAGPKKSGNCETCHTKSAPTRGDSELKPCPIFHAPKAKPTVSGPDKLDLNYYKDGNYGPARFDHRGHAGMASMSRDNCWTCHHNQKDPAVFKKCSGCHDANLVRENLNSPHLKAAFHQQCLNCHKEWDPGTKCAGICHNKNAGGKDAAPPTKSAYRKLDRPVKLVYNTAKQQNTKVTFFHNAHTDMFGAECGDCHKDARCSACHDRKQKAGAAAATIPKGSGVHYKCDACHDTIKDCGKCHAASEKKEMAFDHAQTGFPLKGYHAGLPCARCHGTKIGKLDSNCASCHKNWNSGNFDHGKITGFKLEKYHARAACVKCHRSGYGKLPKQCAACHKGWNSSNFNHEKTTGLKLGENHASLDCENCHAESRYDAKPTCEPCHEGYSYPDVTPEY